MTCALLPARDLHPLQLQSSSAAAAASAKPSPPSYTSRETFRTVCRVPWMRERSWASQLSDNMKNSRYSKMRNRFTEKRGYIVTAVVASIASSVFTALVCFIVYKATLKTDDRKLLSAPSQHGKRPCPPDWIGHQKKCFYFSNEEKNWTASQEFCSSYNASLAIIETEELKDFVRRYIGSTPHWIGFRRYPGQDWKWINGNPSTWMVLGNGGNCAFLNDEGKASSSMCRTVHHWICSKPDEFTSPKIA